VDTRTSTRVDKEEVLELELGAESPGFRLEAALVMDVDGRDAQDGLREVSCADEKGSATHIVDLSTGGGGVADRLDERTDLDEREGTKENAEEARDNVAGHDFASEEESRSPPKGESVLCEGWVGG
jgi:hypothetical protein